MFSFFFKLIDNIPRSLNYLVLFAIVTVFQDFNNVLAVGQERIVDFFCHK